MECKTCEQYVLAELETAQKLLEQIAECVYNTEISSGEKITLLETLLKRN